MSGSRHAEGLDPELARILAGTRLLALDVDGVLTDGRVVYVGEAEQQSFHVRDGVALGWLHKAGVAVTWITGRGCDATRCRARELGVRELHLFARNKAAVLADVQQRLGVEPQETVAMGDDLPDLGLAARAALFACPADASADALQHADLVTRARGGEGAVRELAEHVLRARNAWTEVLGGYAG